VRVDEDGCLVLAGRLALLLALGLIVTGAYLWLGVAGACIAGGAALLLVALVLISAFA
jgi:hypothetical protein